MAEAKKCDLCGGLYEKDSQHEIAKYQLPMGISSTRRYISVQMTTTQALSAHAENGYLVETCPTCAGMNVRELMKHLKIKENKGESLTCTIREGKYHVIYFEKGPALSEEDNAKAQDENRDFFAGYTGKRVRITVEVL